MKSMAARFVPIDRDTPLLRPPNLRDWVPADHPVHFIVDAVAALDLRQVKVFKRGTGSEQYPPTMMPALATVAGKQKYKLRQQTVEPVFGIIKSVPGFRQFLLRGWEKTKLEWTLVSLACDCKRLYRLGARLKLAGAG